MPSQSSNDSSFDNGEIISQSYSASAAVSMDATAVSDSNIKASTQFSSELDGSVSVFNEQSYPIVGDYWTVDFDVHGTHDLVITPINSTTFGTFPDDLDFVSLYDGNGNSIAPEFFYTDDIIPAKSVRFQNYSSDGVSSFKMLVNTPGKHNLMLEFGLGVAYANNYAIPVSTVEINGSTDSGPVLANSDYFGSAIANIGDLNNDGVDDLAVGAIYDDGSSGIDQGAIHVLFMNTDGTIDSTVEINGSTNNGPDLADYDYFGTSIANIGDLNNDNVVDLAVGAIYDDDGGASRGAIHVLFMNIDGTVKSTVEINGSTDNGPDLADDDSFGSAIANIGDMNNDNIVDLAVGANGDDGSSGIDQGAIHVLFMNIDGTVKSTAEINGSTDNGPDLAVSDQFGSAIANIGDMNGDNIVDLAVGAYYDNGAGDEQGAIHVLFMNADGTVKSTAEINGSTTNGPDLDDNDFFGSAIANIGDMNRDGVVDLAVGAIGDDNSGDGRGAIHVLFMNADGTVKSTVEINGSTTNGPNLDDYDLFGSAIANIGDMNRDGVVDLAVGAHQDDGSGTSQGAIHVLFMDKTVIVDNVTSTTKDGTYAPNDIIDITVIFSESVTVTGVPQITLETGSTDRAVDYLSGSGTDTLLFQYTVQSGDVSSDLDYVDTTSLALNGGTITATEFPSHNVILDLKQPRMAGSLSSNKDLIVDTIPPVIIVNQASVQITVGRAANGDAIPGETINEAVKRAGPNDTVIVPDGTYHNQGKIVLKKLGVTLQSTNADHTIDNVILTGDTTVIIRADQVTVAGLEFVNSSPASNTYDYGSVSLRNKDTRNNAGYSDIDIIKNSFTNTLGNGISLRAHSSVVHTALNVSENTFSKIGFNVPDDEKPLFDEHGDKASGHNKSAIIVRHVSDSIFEGNIIDETTWSGIGLDFVSGLTVNNNTISNVPKNGIQVARSPDSDVIIAGNTITNATFTESKVIHGFKINADNLEEVISVASLTDNPFTRYFGYGTDLKSYTKEQQTEMVSIARYLEYGTNLKGAISISSSTGVTIRDNIIKDSRNGVLLCPGNCDGITFEPFPDGVQSYLGTSSATVTGNTFVNIATKAIINSVPDYVLDATRNYYGTEAPDFDELLYGTVRYSPFWTDKVGGTLKADGLAIQYASAEVERSLICSISLAQYYLAFDDAAWGETSKPVVNGVLNAGDEVLSGVKITTSGWKDSNDVAVANAKSLLVNGGLISLDPVSSGNALTATDYADLLSTNSAGIEYLADLPKPGTEDTLELGFKLDLSEIATGPDSEIYETVQYAGSCTK